MATVATKIEKDSKINIGSLIEAASIQLINSRHTRKLDINSVYELACKQPNVIVTDAIMADHNSVGLFKANNKVLVSITGQDTGRSPWARHVIDPTDKDEMQLIERMIKNVTREMIAMPLVMVSCFFGRSENCMGRMFFVVPEKYAKHALDFVLNFVPETDETVKLYEESKELGFKHIQIISHPDWVNPDWLAWRARVNPNDVEQIKNDPEPARIKMLFDVENNVVFLLGNYYFGECKKGALSLIWSSFLNNNLGMPIHGSSKSIVLPDDSEVSFVTIGLSGSGKSSIGNDYHENFVNDGLIKDVKLGNDDAIVCQFDADETSGLEESLYNKTDSYEPGSFWEKTIQTAENALVIIDDEGNRRPYYMNAYCPNGRCISTRSTLKGADPKRLDVPAPNYIATLQKDDTWGPVTLIEDPHLQVALYITICTKSTFAENISLDELGVLKISPGANPFGVWKRNDEANAMLKLINKWNVKGLVMNTGGFFISKDAENRGEELDIPKELSTLIYPLVATNQIEWVEWDMLPSASVPKKGSMEKFFKGYDEKYMIKDSEKEFYKKLFKNRITDRINWMKENKIDKKFIQAIEI